MKRILLALSFALFAAPAFADNVTVGKNFAERTELQPGYYDPA